MTRFEFAGTVDAEDRDDALHQLIDVLEALPVSNSPNDAIGSENVYFKIWEGGANMGNEEIRQDPSQEPGGEAAESADPQTTESPAPDVDVDVNVDRPNDQQQDESQRTDKGGDK